MELIRRRWSKKYINCWEDKRDYDIMKRGFFKSQELFATEYCEKFCPPDLTDEEKKEISDYWGQFGIKIYDFNWHRMYYHATGNHDPRFLPDLVAGFILFEYYNDRVYENTWRDKNMFSRLLPGVPLPKELGRCARGRFFNKENGCVLDFNEFTNIIFSNLNGPTDIVIKNTRDTGYGIGVSKYSINTIDDIQNALKEWSDCPNFIIQECVRPHKTIASLNESSSNMIRIGSWRHGDQVDILFAGARVGAADSFTDVSFVDGEERVNLVGISKDGFFENKMVDQYGRFVKDSQTWSGAKVPSWEKIIDIIKKNHILMDNFDLIGWDFTVDEDGNPICFEWNIHWPGTVLYQYANGKPLYGDKTDEILSFLKDKKNRDNYVPYYMWLENYQGDK